MKPKYEPKVGDVVRLVGFGEGSDGSTVITEAMKGTVEHIGLAANRVAVRFFCESKIAYVYPSQCRKIVVKKRRRVWIKTLPFRSGNMFTVSDHPVNADYVEFVEARKRK